MLIKQENILLPSENVDKTKWSVIAFDQLISNKEYWQKIKNYVGDSPSTLNLVLPNIDSVNSENYMSEELVKNYFNNNVFEEFKNCYILVERETPYHSKRLGLVCGIDIENYDFNSKCLIRASEETIKSRIVPMVHSREHSLLDLPHTILLYDDREFSILENLYKNKNSYEKVYDFDLNGNGGHIKGYKINISLENEFNKLLDKDYLKRTFGIDEKILFIVGDGNHSMAIEKIHWNNIKSTLSIEERKNSNDKYCLVEICNINDEGIELYPIHRLIYNWDKNLLTKLQNLYSKENFVYGELYYNNSYHKFKLPRNPIQSIKLIQDFLEDYSNQNNIEIQYIHEKDLIINACKKNNLLGIFMPKIPKNEIFKYIIKNGVMPKKSFSIGKSCEKRYYLESKKIN